MQPSRLAARLVATFMLISLAALSGAGRASAADLKIGAFVGSWQGSAISESEISVNFQITARDLDVVLRTDDDGGFTITWSTVLRQKGDPGKPAEVLKQTTRSFLPSARPGVWSGGGDALLDPPYIWARIAGNSLRIYSLAVSDSGAYEMQVYDRTLSGLGMELEFRRIIDGETARTARGRLIKVAD
ncbi:hypothetical protein [Oceanibacterium hippocampi]|uniref:Lipocalin-like domain-containing protein n=1 Tax=Oceanibacterium hippocampi TaxID=745714 RepID=A0A1Y5U231_9PROT|nr:hypothetical protein [Oceanibacterium hippocampi]SLN74664.1 hypothetical protein OCH7691_03788 [Oceanibacterium hippocampi]